MPSVRFIYLADLETLEMPNHPFNPQKVFFSRDEVKIKKSLTVLASSHFFGIKV